MKLSGGTRCVDPIATTSRPAAVVPPIGWNLPQTELRTGRRPLTAGLLVVALLPAVLAAQNAGAVSAELSFEELANITVTIAAKRDEPLFASPAAVAVLTGDAIHRSAATTLPEALRCLPGLNVAQINAAEWAVTARGFNARYSNKLLVLVDGRTVYTPTFSGVYWDALYPMLDDLDRIEVVRGPGGTLWGANAVNGVINILSKSARDTQGGLLYAAAGNENRADAGVRYGWALNPHAWLRVFASHREVDASRQPAGAGGVDGYRHTRAGFRFDSEPGANARFTLQGDAYRGTREQLTTLVTPAGLLSSDRPLGMRGGFLQASWSRTLASDAMLRLGAFWDYYERESFTLTETRHTFDLELQHDWRAGSRHQLTWGAGSRFSPDSIQPGPSGGFVPADYDHWIVNAFAQDEITLVPDKVRLTLGAKLEYNGFTGFELLPSTRLLWTPTERSTLWAAVSRAVRNPNRADDAIHFDVQYVPPGNGSPLPLLARAQGDHHIGSENLLAYEAGWRLRPVPRLTADLSVFLHEYDSFILGEPDATGTYLETSPGPPHLVAPVVLRNAANGRGCGAEVTLAWQPATGLRLAPYYSYARISATRRQPGVRSFATLTDSAPRHQGGLRLGFDLPEHAQLDVDLRWVGAVQAYGVAPYLEAEVRLAWEVQPGLELALCGQNLLDGAHDEFGPQTTEPRYELQRSATFRLTRRF